MVSLSSLNPQAIRRDVPIPLHYQLSELLLQEIVAGRWQIGEQIPAEEELCAHFTLSRTTVRKALDALVIAGLVRREKGRGTFVAEPKLVEGLVNRPVGFFDDMAERGIHVSSRVLEMRQVQPPENVARQLDLGPGESAIVIERVRFIRNEPVLVVTTYVPYSLCPDLLQQDLTENGLYALLREKQGYRVDHAKRFVEAVAATDREAQLLKIKRGAPLLLIESTVYLEDGRPIDYYVARHRGDRLRLIIETRGCDRMETKESIPS
jgi:GntR family transcriptional regulator